MTTVTAGRGSHSSDDGIQAVVDDGVEHIEQVGFQPHEHDLRFRVAEPDVEFEHLRAPGW